MAASHRGLLLALMVVVLVPACQVVLDLKSAVLDPEGAGGGGAGPCEPDTQGACYDGPAETKDVGECKGGTRTCGEDGSWGVCEGQSLPQPETCASTKDENCDGFDCGLWSRIYGDLGWQSPFDVAVDSSGNVYFVGLNGGTIIFDGMPVIASADANAFIAKLGPSGEELWIQSLGAGAVLAADPAGGVVLITYFGGNVDFGGGELVSAGSSDIAVMKLGVDGSHVWSRRLGGVEGESLSDIAIGPSGDVVVAGSFKGMADFGDQTLSSSNGSDDLFVAKLDGRTGVTIWSKAFGDPEAQAVGPIVSVDPVGSVVLAGDYLGTVNFGGQPLPAANGQTASSFLAKLDANGGHAWSTRLCQGECHPKGVAIDSAGSIALAGVFSAEADFGPQTLTAVGGTDVFLVKFTSGKQYEWGLGFGDEGNQSLASVAVEQNGQITIGVAFSGTLSLGGESFVDKGHTDFAVGKIASNGNHLWSRQFGDDSHQLPCLVAVQPGGEVVLLGGVSGSVNFGSGALTAAGNDIGELDIAVVKLGR